MTLLSPDFERIIDQAVAYHYTARVTSLRGQMLQDENTIRAPRINDIPNTIYQKMWVGDLVYVANMLSAFSAELYLKGLCVLNGIKFPRTHNLVLLYDLLPLETRCGIENSSDYSMTFREILETAPTNFVDIRYMAIEPARLTIWQTMIQEILQWLKD